MSSLKDRLIEVTHYSSCGEFPKGVKSASEVSDIAKIDADRLIELAERGVVPHWKIDGGEPLFHPTEVKKWVGENLAIRCEGSTVPVVLRTSRIAQDADRFNAPEEIMDMPGLKEIPTSDFLPGVYFLCKDRKVVYVGQSVCIANRIATHSSSKDFDSVYAIHVPRESLDAVEGALIRKMKPVLNGSYKHGSYVAPAEKFSGADDEALSRVFLNQEATA